MSPFDLVAGLLVLTALLSYLNYRLLRLPTTIGLMALTLLASLAVLLLGPHFPGLEARAAATPAAASPCRRRPSRASTGSGS